METAELTKVTVNVTAEDLQAGEIGHCKRCPIALALQRVLPRCVVRVGSVSAEIQGRGGDFDARLPGIAKDFIDAFDWGHAVDPFAFELSIPASFVPTPNPSAAPCGPMTGEATVADEAARAKAGATFMDVTCVGWPETIDADTLDMSSCDKCVFGQAFDDNFIFVANRLGLSKEQCADLGFCSEMGLGDLLDSEASPESNAAFREKVAAEYRDLRSAWIAERDLRLAAAEEARIEALPAANYACPL